MMLKHVSKLCFVKPLETGSRTLIAANKTNQGPDLLLPSSESRVWDPNAAVKLRMSQEGPESIPPISVPSLFRNTVESLPNNLALATRRPTGEPLEWTWSQYFEEVRTVSKGFIALGLEPFHSVAVLGHNSPEWLISCLSAVHSGGFCAGIYQTNSPQASQYIAKNSRANIIVVDDDQQLAKILAVKHQLPDLKAIVQYTGNPTNPDVISWKDLLEIGKGESDAGIDQRLRNMAINQCCLLVYTSGTTGNPKGTMLSHDNITFAAKANCEFMGWKYGIETVLSYLPLSHIGGFQMDVMMPIQYGATTYFADQNALKGTLLQNLKHYRPTQFVGVPRVFEKIEEALKTQSMNQKGLKKMVLEWSKKQALNHHQMEMHGKTHTSLGYSLARKLVLLKIHDALGFSNAAPNDMQIAGSAVPPETVNFFLSLDIKLLEFISSSEASANVQYANSSGPGNFRVGRVGKGNMPWQMESKLINPDNTGAGELLCRGRGTAMGYLNNKEKTLEAIDKDGWLYTGDVCRPDEEGFYTVVGRIKEILITAGGENVAPSNIEDQIKMALPNVVSNVVVVGDKKKYLTCLITLKVKVDVKTLEPIEDLEQEAINWIASVGGGQPRTVQELLTSQDWPKVEAAIDSGVEKANQHAVSNVAKIKSWRILPKEFSVSGGELGPTLKLKRFNVAEMYKDKIEEMY